jgi:predicted nucleic acid-binding protein
LIVVDASAVIDFLLGRESAVLALREEMDADEHETLHAPDLVEVETLNALRRLAQKGAISEVRAADAVADFGELRLLRYPHAPLRHGTWELRASLTAYDASCLALAEALDGSVLVTADAGLAARAAESLGPTRVRMLE